MNRSPRFSYEGLTPDCVLNALESVGIHGDGRLLALNSYENRVYMIGVEGAPSTVVKFYRPERWREAAILEEHAFAEELAGNEIPVVSPLRLNGRSLHEYDGYRFAVYPMQGGRAPELDDRVTRQWLGRFIGRIHAVGAKQAFQHRTTLDIHEFGEASLECLLSGNFLPLDLETPYRRAAEEALEGVRTCFKQAGEVKAIRLHGDCHAGNVLWTDSGPHFVDFDDCMQGSAIQDLWMLLSGSREEMEEQLGDILAGYTQFADFDSRERHLLEGLRTLRMMHYAAWLARRWEDPAFPLAFPWFNTQNYWQSRIQELREQAILMNEPPLRV
ncbi:MAG: serine/threonine protein kinase [Oxalobacter sp.]|nr:MAG: serine/threonine protein kinase [Oxalobacter sp.]